MDINNQPNHNNGVCNSCKFPLNQFYECTNIDNCSLAVKSATFPLNNNLGKNRCEIVGIDPAYNSNGDLTAVNIVQNGTQSNPNAVMIWGANTYRPNPEGPAVFNLKNCGPYTRIELTPEQQIGAFGPYGLEFFNNHKIYNTGIRGTNNFTPAEYAGPGENIQIQPSTQPSYEVPVTYAGEAYGSLQQRTDILSKLQAAQSTLAYISADRNNTAPRFDEAIHNFAETVREELYHLYQLVVSKL